MIDERAINHVETLTSLSSEVGGTPYLKARVLQAASGGGMCHWTAILQLSGNNRDMALEANRNLPFDLWLSKQRAVGFENLPNRKRNFNHVNYGDSTNN